MRKKSLFDIAMEEKNRKQLEDENVVVTKKNSKISIAVSIIGGVIKFCFYVIVCVLLTVGTTVVVNSELREQLIEVVKMTMLN